ncbi:MAG: hypothetical protein DHS20C15_21330 [Planctomycetota bacterium]|nr:MAG: hypothetical protein DHS20C15_21330 [Planctomycetota bacterium]
MPTPAPRHTEPDAALRPARSARVDGAPTTAPRTTLALRRALREALLAGSVALLLGACSSFPQLDLNPLLRVEHTPDGATEVEALGPILAWRSGPDGLSHALRPLYQHKANFGHGVTDWLAPFGRRFEVPDGVRWRFWPLVWTGETRESLTGEEWDTVIFPIVYAGGGPEQGDGYFAIWPLGGRIRNVFGLETFDFFLWPFFSRIEMDITEQSTSWTVLLGGGWTTGGPRDGSWRALPFYRHRLVDHADGTPRTDQHTVLWPFFTWGDDFQDTKSPSKRYAFWPLFSWEQSQSWLRSTWLWPFFRWNRSTDPSTSEGGEFLYDLPWPIFRWSHDDVKDVFRIFPLYSRQTTDEIDSIWSLILFWWREQYGRTTDPDADLGDELRWPPRDMHRQDSHVFPFWHRGRRTVEGREGADTQLQVWPLFHTDTHVAGRHDDAFPSLVPVRHYEFLRPVEELYSPFWTLWRHRSRPGAEETRLLFDTVLWKHSEEGLRISLPFLYSRVPLADATARHQYLWGLVGHRNDEAGMASLSILGLPLWQR